MNMWCQITELLRMSKPIKAVLFFKKYIVFKLFYFTIIIYFSNRKLLRTTMCQLIFRKSYLLHNFLLPLKYFLNHL